MRGLLVDLCRELEADYGEIASRYELPVGFFQLVGQSLKVEAYSNWKVVGWIEALNDLVYFLDILQQWERERERRGFTKQLFAECQEKLFEHSYLEDLFPSGRPLVSSLEKRLTHLCGRLAQEITQESVFFDPALAAKWCRQRGLLRWDVRGMVCKNFERTEEPGKIPVGISGESCRAPQHVLSALIRSRRQATFWVEPSGIAVKIGTMVSPLWTGRGARGEWHWTCQAAMAALETDRGPVTV
ncbi:MAG: hypothetical protein ACT4OL_08630, partial [Nitrospiraceae bacterium]